METPNGCECSCCCGEDASTTDDCGSPVCDDCSSYYVDDNGDVVCARVQTSDDPCRHCGERIRWGGIQTHGAGWPNDVRGECGCREWWQTERGPGNWKLSEGEVYDREEDRS